MSSVYDSSYANDADGKCITVNGISFSFSYFQYIGNPNSVTDPEVKLLCKSLLKRDTKTKLRALSKISEFFDQKDNADFYSFMEFYGEAYPKLAIHNDKFVRAASHKVVQILVAKHGKKYAFYLKNVIPIWLMGLYDPEKTVVYEVKKCMSNIFSDEKLKNLYKIFQHEIFAVITFFINNESSDTIYDTFSGNASSEDASVMYARTYAVILRLLTYMISNDLVKDELKADVTNFLADKPNKLWSNLTNNMSNPSYIILKQSLLQLAINCFTHKVKLSSSSIFKQTFKLIKQMPKNQSMIPSLINLVVVLLIHLNLSSLKGDLLSKFKAGFYQILPFAEQIDFYEFLTLLLNKSDIIDYSDVSEFKHFTAVFASNRNQSIFEQYVKFMENFFPKFYNNENCNTSQLIKELIKNTTDNKIDPKFAIIFNKINANEEIVEKLYHEEFLKNYVLLLQKLDNKKVQTLALFKLIIKFVPSSNMLKNTDNTDLEEYLELSELEIKEAERKDQFLQLIELLVQAVQIKSNLKYVLLHNFFKDSFQPYLDETNINILLSILLNLDKDISVVEHLDKTSIFERVDEIIKFINDVDSSHTNKIFKNFLYGCPNKNINLGKSKELENFIHDTIILGSEESFDSDFRSILKICFKFANSTEMLSLLYIKILNSEILKTNQLLGFWDEYFYSVNFSENFFTFNEKIKSLSGSESIFKFFWNNISNKNVKKYLSKIEKLLDDNQNDLFNCYFNSLCESLEHSDAERLCVIADYFKDKVDIIYPENEDVYSIMVNLYDVNDAMSLASIDNSLNKFVYFIRDCPEGTTKFRFENINYLIYWVNLLAKVNGNDIDLIVLIDLLCLFTSDYLFFHNDASKDLDNSEKLAISEAAEDILFTLKDELSSILIKEIGNKTSLISAIFSIEEMESETIKSVHESMEGSLHDIIRFYYAKLYQEILTSLGKKSADGKPFPKDISKKISKELIKPKKFLKVLAMAPLYEIIIVSDDLEFFKKTILSEVIGYGGVNSTGLDEFFINLQLLNTVLTISGCSAIPGVQLNMLVRRFKQWLDAEIAYDLEFMPARMNIINFFNIYLSKFGFTTLDHEFEFIVSDLFINSLSIVSNSEIDADFETNCEKQDSTSYELGLNINLNICCLKFFSFLETTKDDNDFLIKEISDEMSEELIKSMMGIFKNRYITKFQVNQGLLLNISFYKKLFKGSLLNFEALKEHYGSLVESFKSIENNHNIRLVEFKRSMIFIIGKLTNKISRDTSIELALNVTSLTKDEDIQNKMFKIPQNFVDIISDTSGIEDYIEYESFNSLYNYLWSWIQIFECFSENMPSLLQKKYLEQLPENSIESLLNIIFKQIDVGKDELINSKNEDSLVSEITNYDVCSTGSTCSLREIKIILLHLYYTVLTKFRFKGSEWFRDLRNVHTKSKIENFTAKYISPTIIEDLMKDLQEILIKNQVNEQFKDSKETQADKDEEDFNLDDIHSVKFSKGSHEIKSQYVVDEEKTEIGFKVPRLFPLSNIVVNAPSRMAVKEVTWQSWILQCQNLMNKINSNNATQSAASLIFDAVDLFDKNFRLHFKGFQECAICYSILDAYDKTLPNKSCHTCHNKFHGACLLKWFKSSGDYSCPLCRCKFQLHSKRQ